MHLLHISHEYAYINLPILLVAPLAFVLENQYLYIVHLLLSLFCLHRLKENLDIGIGAGLTTSFGVPLVMPMTFVKWTSSGQYEINIEAMNNIKASVARRFGNKFKLAAVCDMDGMSSVFREEGKNKLYSVMRMRAYLRPELQVAKKSSVYMNVGLDLYNSVNVTNKSIKGFADNFTKDDRWKFDHGFNIMVGFKYGF